MIRLSRPSIDETDLAAVEEVLQSGMLVQGQVVRAFEAAVAAVCGSAHAVAVSNCTAALHLAVRALGLGPGTRVATGAYSWPATANAIALNGAEPTFVDIDPGTFNIDVAALEAALDRDPTIRAIMPVHTFGGMADMARISALANRRGLPVIEDAACALGAKLHGKGAGSWGRVGCFSFHPRKSLTTGEGGVIATDDAELARRLRILRNHGLDPDSPEPRFVEPGFNARLTEFQAALGVTQLSKRARIFEARRVRALEYDRLLRGSGLQTPTTIPGAEHVYQTYVVLVPERSRARRNQIIAALKSSGIEVTIGTHHVPLTQYYREKFGHRPGDFPVTDNVAERAISLPLHEQLTAAEQAEVARALAAAVESER